MLTPRDIDLLRELHTGASDKEIAARLGLTAGTIKVYLTRIRERLGDMSRVQLALWVERGGLSGPLAPATRRQT